MMVFTPVAVAPVRFESGAGETTVAVTGRWPGEDTAGYQRRGADWQLRGLALGRLFRLVLELDDASALRSPALVEGARGLLPPDSRACRAAALGPDSAAALEFVKEQVTEGPVGLPWMSDARACASTYCEVDLRASAVVAPDQAVLIAAYTRAELGRRHDSALMKELRHARPMSYTLRDTVIDCGGYIEIRLRVGGAPTSCAERVTVGTAVAQRVGAPADCARALGRARAILKTEIRGGGQPGSVALDLSDRLEHVLLSGMDSATSRLDQAWRGLSWRVEHKHHGPAQ